MDTEKRFIKEAPEPENRRIEISIFDEKAKVMFETSGNVSRRTAHRFLESMGRAFVPEEPRRGLMPSPGYPVAMGKISCEHVTARDCVDYPTKCSECAKNMAKSYFKPKKEET